MTWWLLAGPVLIGWLAFRIRANSRIQRPPVLDERGEPYEVIDIALSDGATIPLIDAGEGPAVLLVPGADGIRQTWRYQIPGLARTHRVLAPDLRSEFAPAAKFDRFARDIDEILDARGVQRSVVVGQSLGGAISLHYAASRPERVRGLAVVNSLARVSYEHVGLNRVLLVPVAMATTRYLPTIPARWFARMWSRLEVWVFDASPGADRVIDYVLWSGPRTVPPAVSSARVALFKGTDLTPELASIRAPTLVMKGPHDHYLPVAWSREIAGAIPGARYAEVPGTGHCGHVSMPERFNPVLFGWIDGIERVGESPGSKEAEG